MDRNAQLRKWLDQALKGAAFELSPASSDASFRRYFRVAPEGSGDTFIVMDAPPSHEDCRPWLKVAELFGAAGVHVPEIVEADLDKGFILMSDLGSKTYLDALDADNAHNLYAEALGSLIAIQRASHANALPEYSRELLLREMRLFDEWFVARHKGIALDESQKQTLETAYERILAVNLAEPRVFVHRDYHSRNLMVCEAGRNPGIVDFQDAVFGPISYDLVSLLKDAYIHWDEEFTLDLLVRYWDIARRFGLPVRADFADFQRDFDWMGVQRHLKVLGIFARLHHRDGKDGYLKDMPLVMDYLRRSCARYGELKPLLRLLDVIEPGTIGVGYTF
ncbi:aminoglycoside phosphotransferase family protein [Azoarcus taiwanensis]|uniref:Phosphotransferase n=1 Tax=Azoarcus taiwanensis TaxID=666964 RepID=A0A972FGZ8_9RHOO|nr:phosphotransferase [Azoarcus taiwanensis]NMG02146.1 phosphotransferase [Azoarcus taiwanensis]